MTRLLWGASSAFFLLLLSSLFGAPQVPQAGIALLAAVPLVVIRPQAALLAVAVVVPIASWTGRGWSGAVAWPEAIVLAYLAGYAMRRALGRDPSPADAFRYAVHAMIAVVAGSVAVKLLFLDVTLGGAGLRHALVQWAASDYFIGDGGFAEADAAMRMIEGLLLALAAATYARTSPAFGPRLLRALVIGAVIAGLLTLWRLWLGAVRTDDPALAFLRYLWTVRFNAHYSDVNAAGSYYAMVLLPALALAWQSHRWITAVLVIALALALTGSRAAFIATPVAAALIAFRMRQRTSGQRLTRSPRVWVAGATLLVIVSAGMFFAANSRNATPVTRALEFRKEFTLTSIRMIASHPIFGVGIGEYREASAAFSSPELRAVYASENAHNNYLQILGELGAVGFAVFGTVLVLSGRRIVPLLAASTSPAILGAAGGLLAFLLTCVAGHPLLVDEPACTFWLLLGAITGGASSILAVGHSALPPTRRLTAAVLLIVGVSIPIRAQKKFARANLEHVGIGLSRWHTGVDDIRYRLALGPSTVFVPSAASMITLPVRVFAPGGVVEVELYLDGRHVNTVRVTSAGWTTIPVALPGEADGPRFRALRLQAVNSPRAILMIGKVQPH